MLRVGAVPVPAIAIVQITLIATHTLASPVWMPQFLSGGSGRNIRHLPCVSRRTGEEGTCMFAYTCMKVNGTHLGTCIDRFYFGSCCKIADYDPLENDVNFGVLPSNKVTENDPLLHPSVSTIVDAVKLGTSVTNAKTSTVKPVTPSPTISTTSKIYVPISTSSTSKNKTEIFGDTIKKPVAITTTTTTTTTQPSTTQHYLLSTFQVVHDNNKPTTPSTPTKTNSIESTTRTTTTTTTAKITTKTTTKKPIKISTTTKKPPTKKPTAKPTTKPVKATTPKPVTTTKKSTSTSTIYKPVSTITNKPTVKPTPKPTKKPVTTTTTTTTTTEATTLGILSTTSEVVFTKPGSDFLNSNSTAFSTFRPDLSATTKPPLITGSGLTTFTYISDRVTTSPTTDALNEITTEKESASANEVIEEQSNLISQQAGTTTSTSTESISEPTTKVPWIEITPPKTEGTPASSSTNASSAEVPSSTTDATTLSTETTQSTTSISSPNFGNLNVSDYTQVCGRRLYPESRVVGGEKATFGKWPWQISLRQWRTSTYLHKCGAALLNENWAITAAHCVENVPPSDLLLRLGEHDLSREDEPYGYQERRVQIVASHPQFDPRTFEYDLALLRFYEPVKFQPNIIPICVPEDSTNFVGQDAHVTGWGRLYEDGPLPSVLQEVSVPVINNTICENMYRSAGYIEHIPDIFICAGWKKGGFDSCEGDSGGPMVIQRPDKRWLLAGVISWGIGCAEPNQPGVYTRISQFRDWINQILQF